MIRHALATILVVAAAGCSKKTNDGMPPASDWGSAQPPAAKQAPSELPPPPPMQTGQRGENDQEPEGDQQPPPDHAVVAEATAPKQLEKQADGKLVLGPFTMAVPADWAQKPVTSSMRAADFTLPAKPGADAELIIYYFGPSGAGSVQDNLDRWIGQFTQDGGKPSKDVAKIEKAKFGGQEATVVSVTGHFSAPAMMGGGDAVDKPDQSLLGAIVASPNGPYYFKLVGAKATVAANEARFRDMLKSLTVK